MILGGFALGLLFDYFMQKRLEFGVIQSWALKRVVLSDQYMILFLFPVRPQNAY